MQVMINWLRNAKRYYVKPLAGKGDLYCGPAPFSFSKLVQEDMDRVYNVPWAISHPDAMGKLYKVIDLESYAIFGIREGMPIGLLVNEWTQK